MQIGQLARITGVPERDIRHYQQVSLLPPSRVIADTEDFTESHIHALKLIKMAKAVGFSLREIITVLGINQADQAQSHIHVVLVLIERQRKKLERLQKLSPEKTQILDRLLHELRTLSIPA